MTLHVESAYQFTLVCVEYVATEKQKVPEILSTPLSLTGSARSDFVTALRDYPITERYSVEVTCAQGSEASCTRAAQYLIALSEAGWPLKEPRNVRRIPPLAVPPSGVTVVSHTDAAPNPNRPIHLGTFQPLNDSAAALYGAFQLVGITLQTQGDQGLPVKELILYFGPELDK
ncbi:MAG: hypothetical protein ABSB35_34420 [Bryobacteraceae bacterium]|jgi:hypothetical protein